MGWSTEEDKAYQLNWYALFAEVHFIETGEALYWTEAAIAFARNHPDHPNAAVINEFFGD